MVCKSLESVEDPPFIAEIVETLQIPPSLAQQRSRLEEMETETSAFLPPSPTPPPPPQSNPRGVNTPRRGSRNLGILVISSSEDEVPLKQGEDKPELSNGVSIVIQSEKDNGGNVEVRRSGWRGYIGILLTLASGLVFTLGGVIVKYMKDYHPFTLAVYRFQGILLPSLFMVLWGYRTRGKKLFAPIWPITKWENGKRVLGMIGRSAFGTTALFLHFYALKRLDVADASVIGACQPVFVTFAAYLFLGESCGIFPVFTAFLTIIGVGVISRPPILTGEESFNEEKLIGAGFAFASVITATTVFVIIRYLKDVHFALLTFILGCWGTVQSLVCSFAIGEFKLPQTGEHWALAGALAVVTLISQVGLTLALQYEQAGPVALVRTCDCLFAFVLQFILLNTLPDMYSLVGASIIIFSIAVTATRKWISMLPDNHPWRKRFSFMLK